MKAFIKKQHENQHKLAMQLRQMAKMKDENTRLKEDELESHIYAAKMKAVSEDKFFYKTIMIIAFSIAVLAVPLTILYMKGSTKVERDLGTDSYSKKDRSIEMQSTKSLVDTGDEDEMDLDDIETERPNEVVHASTGTVSPQKQKKGINEADF
jgi:hypothetical protein